MPDTHDDIRRRLFEAAWETPTYPPAPERTVSRARRRAARTIGGGLLAAVLAIVVAASAIPVDESGRITGVDPKDTERNFLVDVTTGNADEIRGLGDAWWADVSPDGRQILYTNERSGSPQLWTSHIDGSDARQLTHVPGGAYDGAWSPDGRRIAYAGPLGANNVRDLYVLDVEAGRAQRVTASDRDVFQPEWSPDGRSILYTVAMAAEPDTAVADVIVPTATSYQLRVVDLATGEIRRVAGGAREHALDGAWMADGRIAYGSGLGITVAGPRRNALRAVEPDGTGTTLLLRTGRDMVQLPAVSPDGLRIAFVRLVHGGDEVICIYDLETGRTRRLVAGFYVTWVDDDTLFVQDHPA
jgi:TolB protein